MTLSALAWNIVRTCILTPGRRFSFGCRYRLGTASNLVMYVSAADNDYVGVTGTFLGTAAQGVWSTARLQPEHPREDQVRLVVMDVCIREAAVEAALNKNAKTVGQATKRATQELVGDDKNERPGQQLRHADRNVRPLWTGASRPRAWRASAGSGATTLSEPRGPATPGHTRRYTAPPKMWRATELRLLQERRQVPAQQGPHGPAHQGRGGRRGFPSTNERGRATCSNCGPWTQ